MSLSPKALGRISFIFSFKLSILYWGISWLTIWYAQENSEGTQPGENFLISFYQLCAYSWEFICLLTLQSLSTRQQPRILGKMSLKQNEIQIWNLGVSTQMSRNVKI